MWSPAVKPRLFFALSLYLTHYPFSIPSLSSVNIPDKVNAQHLRPRQDNMMGSVSVVTGNIRIVVKKVDTIFLNIHRCHILGLCPAFLQRQCWNSRSGLLFSLAFCFHVSLFTCRRGGSWQIVGIVGRASSIGWPACLSPLVGPWDTNLPDSELCCCRGMPKCCWVWGTRTSVFPWILGILLLCWNWTRVSKILLWYFDICLFLFVYLN